MVEKKLVPESPVLAADRKWVQFLLRGGLGVSLISMLIGVLILTSQGQTLSRGISMWSLFGSEALPLGEIFLGWGVLILAMTPVFRVVMLAVLWTREKDWKFVAVALCVLTTLGISIFLGGH